MLRNIQKYLNKFNLRKQITVLLSLIFLGGILICAVALGVILHQNAQAQITAEAEVAFKTIMSVRAYTNAEVTPIIESRSSEEEFFPQTIPSYAAREVFSKVRNNPDWKDYFYKEATLNPSNLRDKADQFETTIINQFRDNPNLNQLTGFQSTFNGELFYIAQPTAITEPSCLQCHDTPEKAPKSVIERYGSVNGFGWKLNEIVGASIIYVPTQKIFQKAYFSFILLMTLTISILGITLFLVNSWLKRSVIRPLCHITQAAEAISTGDLDADFDTRFDNEIGKVAQAFKRMKTSLVLAMQRLQKYRS
jgi:methyl-accepting chemotaxis protein